MRIVGLVAMIGGMISMFHFGMVDGTSAEVIANSMIGMGMSLPVIIFGGLMLAH